MWPLHLHGTPSEVQMNKKTLICMGFKPGCTRNHHLLFICINVLIYLTKYLIVDNILLPCQMIYGFCQYYHVMLVGHPGWQPINIIILLLRVQSSNHDKQFRDRIQTILGGKNKLPGSYNNVYSNYQFIELWGVIQ